MKITDNEKLLLSVLDIMEESDSKYWISQGTLLGLVRDGRILPWDNDIDIAVWAHEVSKQEILDLFKKHGYEEEYVPGDVDCLHFKGGAKCVDVGFHNVVAGTAMIKWVTPGGNPVKKLFQFLISMLDNKYSVQDIQGRYPFLKKAAYYIVNGLVRIMPISRPRLQIFLTERLGKYCFNYLGYSYPAELLKEQGVFTIFDRDMPVPREYEKVLEMTYGKDWRIPKQDYVWYEEADNLA